MATEQNPVQKARGSIGKWAMRLLPLGIGLWFGIPYLGTAIRWVMSKLSGWTGLTGVDIPTGGKSFEDAQTCVLDQLPPHIKVHQWAYDPKHETLTAFVDSGKAEWAAESISGASAFGGAFPQIWDGDMGGLF